jgi:hypothetical protein
VNFGELRAAVSDRLGVPPAGDALLTAAWLGSAVNTALQVCSSEKDWWWLLSSVTFQFNGGQAAMPSDLLKVEAIQAYSTYLEPVSRRDMLDQINVPLPAPVGWTVIGNVLWLVPAPDGLIDARMLYYRAEPTLVADADVPLMPAVFHDKLVAYAAYLGYLRRQDPVRATQQLADYQQWVKRTDADQSPVKGPRRVRIPRSQAPLAPPSSTLPAQPSISMGGVIVCTSTTRPLAVDGQLIFELDKRRLLQYEAALVDWVPPRGVGFTTLATTPPAHSYDGELWFQGDTRLLVVRDVANAAWLPVRGMVTPCTSATRPANPYEGQPIYETDTDRLLYYTTATTGWQPPWNLPWGYITRSTSTATTAGITTDVDVVTATWTAVQNRRYKISYFYLGQLNTSAGVVFGKITDNTPTQVAVDQKQVTSGSLFTCHAQTVITAAASGSLTYRGRASCNAGTVTLQGAASMPHYLLVEDDGPAGAPA